MPSTTPETLYNVISGRAIDNGRLPTPDDLKSVSDALHAVQEFLTGPILEGCTTVAAAGVSNSVTFEDVGRIVNWVDGVRASASYILDDAERVLIVAREAMTTLAEGYKGDGAPFDENGCPDRGYSRRQLTVRYGFGGSWRGDA